MIENKENLYENDFLSDFKSKDKSDFLEISKSIQRRSKLIISFSLFIFLSLFSLTLYNRIKNPVFLGKLSILITDPLSDKSDKSLTEGVSRDELLTTIASNSSSTKDIPTLLELLRSPLILSPLEDKFNLGRYSLERRLSIQAGGGRSRFDMAKGVLIVLLEDKNKKNGTKLLESIGESYLNLSLEQKQQNLKDGLNFLDAQFPKILKENSDLQIKLAKFRKENNFIDPTFKYENLNVYMSKIEERIINLEKRSLKLATIKEEINEQYA